MKKAKIKNKLFVIPILISLLTAIVYQNTANAAVSSSEQPEYVQKVLDKYTVNELNIQISEEDWNWLIDNATAEEYRSCDITINGEKFYNVGIRTKGNSSLNSIASDSTTDRYSFKLDFGEYMEGQTCYGLQKIALNNIFSDNSYMKEYLSYDMFSSLGVATPACAFTNIMVNGEQWGLYLSVEDIDQSFIDRYYGTVEGNLYKPETMDIAGGNMNKGRGDNQNAFQGNRPDFQQQDGGMQGNFPDIAMGGIGNSGGSDLKYNGDSVSDYSAIRDNAVFKTTTDNDFESVIEMIKNLNEDTNLEQYLDVDEILRYFAVNTFLVNLDSYAGGMYHNYYLYERDGVFQILPWDLNMSFAGFRINDSSAAINFPIDSPVSGNLEDAPLIEKLLEVPEYMELYHQYLQEILDNYINSGEYQNTIIMVDQLIDNYVKNDTVTAFCSYDDYKNAVNELLIFGNDRAGSITAQLAGEQPSTTYGNYETTLNLSAFGAFSNGGMRGVGQDNAAAFNAGQGGMENMDQIREIICETDSQSLTQEQKDALAELGVDETMLETLLGRGNAGGFQARGNMRDMNDGRTFSTQDNNSNSIIIIMISISALGLGLLAMGLFNRKKYHAA